MFPPFPQNLANEKLRSLIIRLENGEGKLVQVGRESVERKGQGVMLGALVCSDLSGNLITLYGVSGNCKNLVLDNYADCQREPSGNQFTKEIVVPSIVSSNEIENALLQYDKEIHDLTDKINCLENNEERELLIKKRTKLTDISLQRVFDLYSFTCFNKKTITLNEIIKKKGGALPPTGTGDCCAPKLLSYAFENNLHPISMDEIYYGNNTKTKINGHSYNPCDDRCGFILPYILGIEILYRDNDLIVVNKESGLLSVPGRGPEKQDCVESRVRSLFPDIPKQPAVHRLDMETSGIMILAMNKDAHREMNRQFSEGLVSKKYMALLDGIVPGIPEGKIELKTRVDINNRPVQILDNENGKLGITLWKKLGVKKLKIVPYCGISKNIDTDFETKTVSIVEFIPITGRTHQLRLAAAFPESVGGLGRPIVGDTLYGENKCGERLMLHAFFVEFNHPVTGEKITIENKIPF